MAVFAAKEKAISPEMTFVASIADVWQWQRVLFIRDLPKTIDTAAMIIE
jgi:hypothetical protein